MAFIKRALTEIKNRQNLDLYLNLLICAVLVVLGLVGVVSSNILFSGILAALLLSVVNSLNTRAVVDNLAHSVSSLAASKPEGLTLEAWDDAKLSKRIEAATQLSCMAIAGYTFISANSQQLKRMLNRGGRARFLLVDPLGNALAMAVARNYGAAKSKDYQATLIRLALQKLKEVADESNVQRLEVKLVDYLPETVMTMIDEHSEDGVIHVTYQGFNQPIATRPSLVLEAAKNPGLFTFHRKSYEDLWNWKSSRTIDLTDYIAKMGTEPTPTKASE
jgi:hypothetical protein